MYKLVNWSPLLDLSEFYKESHNRGFVNNASQKVMIDCFRNEKEWNAWILYYNNRAIGSVAAHSFDEVVPNSYRILARVCVFGEARQNKGLITPKKLIAEHQNLTDQFLLPQCIEWVNGRGRMFATSNYNEHASQRLVHKHYFPTLEKIGIVSKHMHQLYYRGTEQTVWEIHPTKFYQNLEKYTRWTL